MNKNIGILLAAVAILGVGFVVVSANTKESPAAKMPAEVKEVASETPAMMAPKDEVQDSQKMMEKTMAAAGTYQVYEPTKVAQAVATGDVVLFFHASWCPSCRALNASIEESMASIPQGLTILKADYDKETELKKKYGVTSQHTLVQVDKDGNMIKKWSGGSKLESIVSQLQ
jgi:thioredoxin 1